MQNIKLNFISPKKLTKPPKLNFGKDDIEKEGAILNEKVKYNDFERIWLLQMELSKLNIELKKYDVDCELDAINQESINATLQSVLKSFKEKQFQALFTPRIHKVKADLLFDDIIVKYQKLCEIVGLKENKLELFIKGESRNIKNSTSQFDLEIKQTYEKKVKKQTEKSFIIPPSIFIKQDKEDSIINQEVKEVVLTTNDISTTLVSNDCNVTSDMDIDFKQKEEALYSQEKSNSDPIYNSQIPSQTTHTVLTGGTFNKFNNITLQTQLSQMQCTQGKKEEEVIYPIEKNQNLLFKHDKETTNAIPSSANEEIKKSNPNPFSVNINKESSNLISKETNPSSTINPFIRNLKK